MLQAEEHAGDAIAHSRIPLSKSGTFQMHVGMMMSCKCPLVQILRW